MDPGTFPGTVPWLPGAQRQLPRLALGLDRSEAFRVVDRTLATLSADQHFPTPSARKRWHRRTARDIMRSLQKQLEYERRAIVRRVAAPHLGPSTGTAPPELELAALDLSEDADLPTAASPPSGSGSLPGSARCAPPRDPLDPLWLKRHRQSLWPWELHGSGPRLRVVFDCGYRGAGSPGELRSLRDQLAVVDAANQRVGSPAEIHVAGLGPWRTCLPDLSPPTTLPWPPPGSQALLDVAERTLPPGKGPGDSGSVPLLALPVSEDQRVGWLCSRLAERARRTPTTVLEALCFFQPHGRTPQFPPAWKMYFHEGTLAETFERPLDSEALLAVAGGGPAGRSVSPRARQVLAAFVSPRVRAATHHASLAQRIVYLSPDAPYVLTRIDPTKLYVIGGIVDRTRKKNLSLRKAQALGIPCARLPLREHIPITPNAAILTVDQAFQVLLRAAQPGASWPAAVRTVVPPRKQREGLRALQARHPKRVPVQTRTTHRLSPSGAQ